MWTNFLLAIEIPVQEFGFFLKPVLLEGIDTKSWLEEDPRAKTITPREKCFFIVNTENWRLNFFVHLINPLIVSDLIIGQAWFP